MNARLDDTHSLLRQREMQGLDWFLRVMMVATVAWGVGGFVFITAPEGRFAVSFMAGMGLAVELLLWRALRQRHAVIWVGSATILVAFVLIAPSIVMEWRATGDPPVPASYLAKTGFPAAMVLLALSAVTLHPRYPLTVTGLTLLWQLILLGLALSDERIVFATLATWQEHVMGPALHLGKVAYTIGLTMAAGLGVSLVAWTARRTVRRAVELERATGQFGRYFSPEVAARIASADPDFLKPGGRLRRIVVLVSDIGDFTPLSAQLGPDATLRLLADYQARMTAALFDQGGVIDKFMGDGILATFGATGRLEAPERRAVTAALGMNEALETLNKERALTGEPAIRHRIGLHVGEALVGNVGSETRLEFTVIGDVVNLASRIETACKTTGDTVLATAAVVEAVPREDWIARGVVSLPGVTAPPALYALPRGGVTA